MPRDLSSDARRGVTPANRNESRSTGKKRPAITIAASQTQRFRKKKVGFDAEQCGFLRINDIIMTVSGNVTKTYEQISTNSERNVVFFKDSKKVHINNSASSVKFNIPAVTSKEKFGKECVSTTLASYLRADDTDKGKKIHLAKQVTELDLSANDDISKDDSDTESKSSFSTKSSLWQDLKFKNFRSKKQNASLFEMIVSDKCPTAYDSLKTQRKSAFAIDTSSEDKELEQVNIDSFLSQHLIQVGNDKEYKLEPERTTPLSSKKKTVSIIEFDGSVHIPGKKRNIDDLNKDIQPPLIGVSNVPSNRSLSSPSQLKIKSSFRASDGHKQTSDRLSIVQTFTTDVANDDVSDITTVSNSKAPNQTASNINESISTGMGLNYQNSNWSSLTKCIKDTRNKNYVLQQSVRELRSLQQYSATQNERLTNCCSAGLQTDRLTLLCELLQAKLQIETLRRENGYLKRDSQVLISTGFQLPNKPTKHLMPVTQGFSWKFPPLLHFIAAVFFGIVIGEFLI